MGRRPIAQHRVLKALLKDPIQPKSWSDIKNTSQLSDRALIMALRKASLNGNIEKVKEGYRLTEKGLDEAINGIIEREVLSRIKDQYVGLLSTILKDKILEEKDERILVDEDYAADVLLSELEMFRSMQFPRAVPLSQLPAQQFVESMLRYYHPAWIRDLSEDQFRETASGIVESLGNEIDKDEIRILVEKRNEGLTLERAIEEVNEMRERIKNGLR